MNKKYLVKTKKDYDALMRKLESEGLTWASGDKPTEFDGYKKDWVVIVDEGGCITYDTDVEDHPDAELYVSEFCLEITEEQMREICHCPKGYVMNVSGSSFNPFKIDVDGYVWDKDHNPASYGEFLDTFRGEIIEIVPEQPAVEEMTMEQICKALGKTIKIVKE